MTRLLSTTIAALLCCALLSAQNANYAGKSQRFKALVYYTEKAEEAHVDFALECASFLERLTDGNGWTLDKTTSLETCNDLSQYSVIICPNTLPRSEKGRKMFEEYMENGGGWVGFHAAAYNDARTAWPWLDAFLGCGRFKCNNWPPQEALLELDDKYHPVTKNLPREFVVPATEWYQWTGDLDCNGDIEVLASLSHKNYPIGLKDIVYEGKWPVVWTNHKYRMIYLNMGHGKGEFTDATQNLLFINALRWIVSRDPQCKVFNSDKVVVAYVTSWSNVMPDPGLMTHINYAFGHVAKSFDSLRIDNPERLKSIVALKKDNPSLKVLLSIGGWGSGNFSEMAADKALRASFCRSVAEQVEQFALDGIDLDWEYPTSSAASISSSPDDTDNYTLLVKELRQILGKDKMLTMASVCSAQYVDFPSVTDCFDFINVMSYDMGGGNRSHCSLYPSERSGHYTAHTAVKAHLEAGVSADKLVMGVPFYGRGTKVYKARSNDFRCLDADGFAECWDESAQTPYLSDKDGNFVFGYDNARSLGIKCDYIIAHGLRGGMYWDYAGDDDSHTLAKTMATLIK